jgi:hypothetical protein
LANSDGYAAHNRAAFELLEDLLAFDLDVLRPAPELGWLVDDSMVLVRDCLDAFAVAEEWFRGWSAEMLADMCGVPREPAMTAAARIAQKTADLADRMLALRLLEDNGQSDAPAQSWTNIWSSFRTSMLEKLHAEETSPAAIYFRALSTIFDDDLVARAAVRLADGTFESRRHNGQWREEVVQSKGAVRIRFVFRSYITNGPKTAAFNLVRGTVESDLADPAGLSDVTILLTAFVIPPTKDGEWKFEVFFNVLPHTADGTAPDALALRSAFLMSQMLSEEELARLTQEAPRMFYEEV